MKQPVLTIYERTEPGVRCVSLPDIPPSKPIDAPLTRKAALKLPEVSEPTLMRHYTALKNNAFGVDSGFYPLGSCTMKYNPKFNEKIAAWDCFTDVHPLSEESEAQGSLQLMHELQTYLCEITGMDAFTLAPAAGSHGEWTGLNLICAYHASRGDNNRKVALIPDSAHGTNPANASIAGFTVVNIPSAPDGSIDMEVLKKNLGENTAVLMLTNPNTLGMFEKNIAEIARLVHEAGALLYYDGANLNAVMGICRPADMGFDVVHVNLHKTFSTPHGGGGPGSGPVGCRSFLADFLPSPIVAQKNGQYALVDPAQSIGRVTAFYGNFLVCVRAWCYIRSLGAQGLFAASERAVVNANYLKRLLAEDFGANDAPCMHEFVLSLAKLKEETGVSAMDFAKTLIDHGMHPPTMYFPLIVHEALMLEPTETESRRTLDEAAALFHTLYTLAHENPQQMHDAPQTMPISRPDDVAAARNPRLKFE
jgi:glycine dehydrogenase subunit 2